MKILAWIKKETVLCVSLALAAVSMCMVPPDREYGEYIDFRTLAVLFCLMSVMAGLQKAGLFERIAEKLLGHVKSARGLILTLVLLCFFSGMLITNDVALITFVPFTFIVLDLLGEGQRDRLALPVVVMQTIAANLGSMLTPVGNPQNLYLYGKAGISVRAFVALMLPYTVLSLVLLAAWSLIQGSKGVQVRASGERSVSGQVRASGEGSEGVQVQASGEGSVSSQVPGAVAGSARPGRSVPGGLPAGGNLLCRKGTAVQYAVYLALFLLCLLSVGRLLPWQAVTLAVAVVLFFADREVFAKVDYSLLLTFTGFFVFVGNVGRIPAFRDFLQSMIAGREIYTAVLVSQVISNVPAALLLSGFTEDLEGLIVGTNLGGLGTLIASMASLISYKYVAKETVGCRRRYLFLFTAGNLFFLIALLLLHVLLGRV